MSKIKLMSHLVACYPTDEIAFTAARALVKGGADILEIQLPFSDPSADGPAIQGACTKVLQRNYRTANTDRYLQHIFLLNIGALRKKHKSQNIQHKDGSEDFCN